MSDCKLSLNQSTACNYEFLIAPIIGFGLAFLYFILPLRKCFGKRFQAESTYIDFSDPSNNDFLLKVQNFNEDYMRNNPVLSKKSWDD